jgi:hypothetical protein
MRASPGHVWVSVEFRALSLSCLRSASTLWEHEVAGSNPVAPTSDYDFVVLLSSNAMDDTALLTCPYCFENVEIYIDPQSEGELIRDCDVCCRPWSLQVSRGVDGELFVRANRAQ